METTIIENKTDYEVRSLDAMCVNESQLQHKWYHSLKYLLQVSFWNITGKI